MSPAWQKGTRSDKGPAYCKGTRPDEESSPSPFSSLFSPVDHCGVQDMTQAANYSYMMMVQHAPLAPLVIKPCSHPSWLVNRPLPHPSRGQSCCKHSSYSVYSHPQRLVWLFFLLILLP